jgi:hypothetical protein
MPGTPRKKQYGIGKADKTFELALPSGSICLVKRPGVEGLMKAGILDSLDSLTGLVQVEHIDTKDPKKMAQAVKALSERKGDLIKGLDLMNKAVCAVVVEPKVFMPPEDGESRDEAKYYIDEVDEEDKSFIFQFVVGGTRDIEIFRQERQGLMGGLSAGANLPVPAEQAAGNPGPA